ncbi:MAG: type IV toxin-antitoxin system AbiEi family antitoxin domain-containing protein [Kineosporiaceae bacterium]
MLPPGEAARLPDAFTYTQAIQAGVTERRLRAMTAAGLLERVARGTYLRSDTERADVELFSIAARAPDATVCLRSALSRHDLIDDIPFKLDIAIPRGRRAPRTWAPTRWHHFDRATFTLGRVDLSLTSELTMGLYTAERSIIDAFRLRHQEGTELAHAALKEWLRRRGSHPGDLMDMAAHFPKAESSIRRALEVLL